MSTSPTAPFSARATLAEALKQLELADAELRTSKAAAKVARDDGEKKLNGERDRAVKAVNARVATELSEIKRREQEVGQMLSQAQAVLAALRITVQPGARAGHPSSRSAVTPQEFTRGFNAVIDSHNSLVDDVKELERVRGTFLVKVLKSIGLPPI